MEVPDKDKTEREEETVTKKWEVGRANVRRAQELRDIRVSRGMIMSSASKRLGQGVHEEESNASPSSVKKMKTWKHPILGEEWSSATPPPPPPLDPTVLMHQPPPPPPPPTPSPPPPPSQEHPPTEENSAMEEDLHRMNKDDQKSQHGGYLEEEIIRNNIQAEESKALTKPREDQSHPL